VIVGYVYETSSSEFPIQTEIPLTYHSSMLAFLHDPQQTLIFTTSDTYQVQLYDYTNSTPNTIKVAMVHTAFDDTYFSASISCPGDNSFLITGDKMKLVKLSGNNLSSRGILILTKISSRILFLHLMKDTNFVLMQGRGYELLYMDYR